MCRQFLHEKILVDVVKVQPVAFFILYIIEYSCSSSDLSTRPCATFIFTLDMLWSAFCPLSQDVHPERYLQDWDVSWWYDLCAGQFVPGQIDLTSVPSSFLRLPPLLRLFRTGSAAEKDKIRNIAAQILSCCKCSPLYWRVLLCTQF